MNRRGFAVRLTHLVPVSRESDCWWRWEGSSCYKRVSELGMTQGIEWELCDCKYIYMRFPYCSYIYMYQYTYIYINGNFIYIYIYNGILWDSMGFTKSSLLLQWRNPTMIDTVIKWIYIYSIHNGDVNGQFSWELIMPKNRIGCS